MFPVSGIVFVIIAFYLFSSIKILSEYERGVIFRLGRLLDEPKGPGLILVFAPLDRMVRVDLRQVAFDVPPQDVITRDNVTLKVNAVVFLRVIDPRRAVVDRDDFGVRMRRANELDVQQALDHRVEGVARRAAHHLRAGGRGQAAAERGASGRVFDVVLAVKRIFDRTIAGAAAYIAF